MTLGSRFAQFRPRTSRPEGEATDAHEAPAAPGEPARPLLIVGLGNPGADHAQNRHNVGTWCVAALGRRHRVELARSGDMESARIPVEGGTLGIARARTFYNDVGRAVVAEMRRFHATPAQLLVIYDDLDLPVGRVRMRLQGSSGGNNGLKSIIAALGGAQDFPRIRIGIDRPYDAGVPVRDPERIARWVLARPSPPQRAILDAAVERVSDAVEHAARAGYEVAMNELNRWEPPAASS